MASHSTACSTAQLACSLLAKSLSFSVRLFIFKARIQLQAWLQHKIPTCLPQHTVKRSQHDTGFPKIYSPRALLSFSRPRLWIISPLSFWCLQGNGLGKVYANNYVPANVQSNMYTEISETPETFDRFLLLPWQIASCLFIR